jgi:hypothetical protein
VAHDKLAMVLLSEALCRRLNAGTSRRFFWIFDPATEKHRVLPARVHDC